MSALRLILAVILLAAGTMLLFWRQDGVDSSPELSLNEATLLPDTGGPLRLVVCNVNSARRAALRNTAAINAIVNSLPARTEFLLLSNDHGAFTIAANPEPNRVRLLDLPTDSAFTIWTQDPFLVLRQTDGETTLLAARDFDRADDHLVARTVAEAIGASHITSELDFEGGNIVANARHVFVGANTIAHNAVSLGMNSIQVVRQLQRELGRPVMVIGPAPQAIGHIDMMLTPLDDLTVLLGDPDLGAELAAQALIVDSSAVTQFEERCEQMFFGNPRVEAMQSGSGIIEAPQVVDRMDQVIADSRSIAAQLDQVAVELAAHGYRVERVPLLWPRPPRATNRTDADESVIPSDLTRRRASDQPPSIPGYPTLTYNNVLLETKSDGSRVVYLPRYGLQPLDQAAEEVWRELGYTVHPVEHLTISSMYGGSLRCCVKVLQRGPSTTPSKRE